MRFILSDNHGIAVLRDENIRSTVDITNEYTKTLMHSAKLGDIFYIDRKEEFKNLSIELVADKKDAGKYIKWYEPIGGSFLFKNTSGKIVITGLEDWVNSNNSKKVFKIAPGKYSIEVYSQDVESLESYSKELSKHIGNDDWEYYTKTDSLALIGCLPTIVAIIIVIFATLKIGLFSLLLAVVLWLPFIIRSQTKRYKKVTEIVKQYDKELPLFVLVFTKIEDSKGLVGGFVN